jgi:peptidoglycan/LPS O-acetylase OafA/YrhL
MTTAARSAVPRGFISELDGLRGIAILMVMVHRFWPRPGVGMAADVAGAGWIGVDLFFVISGFLIAGILLDTRGEPGYFKNFYARRILRIFPLFYLFIGFTWIAFGSNPEFREAAGSPAWYFLHLGNVPEGVLNHDVPYWLAPSWSLAIEEQFYLTFPLLVYALDRRKLVIVLIAMIVAAPILRFVTTVAAPDNERFQYLFTLCRIDTIAAGVLLAVIIRSIDLERWRPTLIRIAIVSLPFVVVLGVASGLERTSPFDRVFGYSIVALGCASFVALVVLGRDTASTALLRWAPLQYLGKLCFGLYLLHRPADTLVSALAARVGIEGDLRLMPLKIALALLLATLSWRLIERPFLRLKDRFASDRHPSIAKTSLGALFIALVAVSTFAACRSPSSSPGVDTDAPPQAEHRDAALPIDDSSLPDTPDAGTDGPPPDGPPPAVALPLYPEGTRHSPITPAVVARLQSLISPSSDPRVFAKVGDSITVSSAFLFCFDGSYDLGDHTALAPTLSYYLAGNAAGSSPFGRTSNCAVGGTTAADALAGTPSPFARELDALTPRIAVILFGTNEIRYGQSYDQAASHLWELVDATLARGVVPILSTIPPNPSWDEADARIPTYNRLVRAIAQGRSIPLVDFHREIEQLPNRGISSDKLHPSTAPSGGCDLTAAGLEYGYNLRNLLTLEALARVRAALAGNASNATASIRAGQGTAETPFAISIPAADLGDTSAANTATAASPCGVSNGREVVYRLALATSRAVKATVVDRDGVDVKVSIVEGSDCLATDTASASAIAGPGEVHVVVHSTASDHGEFLLVVD